MLKFSVNIINSNSLSDKFIIIPSTPKYFLASKSIIIKKWNFVIGFPYFWVVIRCYSIVWYFKSILKSKQILVIRYLLIIIAPSSFLFQGFYCLFICEIIHERVFCFQPILIFSPTNICIGTYCFVVVCLYQNNCFLKRRNFL